MYTFVDKLFIFKVDILSNAETDKVAEVTAQISVFKKTDIYVTILLSVAVVRYKYLSFQSVVILNFSNFTSNLFM